MRKLFSLVCLAIGIEIVLMYLKVPTVPTIIATTLILMGIGGINK